MYQILDSAVARKDLKRNKSKRLMKMRRLFIKRRKIKKRKLKRPRLKAILQKLRGLARVKIIKDLLQGSTIVVRLCLGIKELIIYTLLHYDFMKFLFCFFFYKLKKFIINYNIFIFF